nr:MULTISPECIES: transporter substrate-binding domain-containing protein [unclassified Herbaspirillum]
MLWCNAGKTQWRVVLSLCLSSLFPLCSFAQSRECDKIVITDDSDYGPIHWYDGSKLMGASIDIVTTALKAIQAPYVIRYVGPMQRVLQAGKDGEVDIIASLRPTPERLRYLEFSKVQMFNNFPTVFVAKGREFRYSGWNDLVGKKGGITAGNQFGGDFDDFMKKNLNVEIAQKTYINFKKLELGRLDYVISGYFSGMGYLLRAEQQDKFVALTPPLVNNPSTLAFSKRSPCLKYLKLLDVELGKMRDRDQFREILNKNVQLYRNASIAPAN